MKYQYLAVAATTLLSTVNAFPRMNPDQLKTYYEHSKKEAEAAGCPFAAAQRREADAAAEAGCPFAKKQKRDDYTPPNLEAGDQRGPCPGLNALANHGYLPHNGVADIQTIIKATNEVYGMSLDLGGFLAVFGTVYDGNPLSTSPGYSIGGPTDTSQNILNGGGLVGTPSGLSGSHNKYESDVSATRRDLYVEGNNFEVQRDRFIDYYYAIPEDTPAPEQYTALAPFHKQRFDESVNTNPHFFYSPFAGILVSPAAYSFPPRMMANHSNEYPEGYLDRQTFASFFRVDGDNEDNFVVKQGHEQIPDNWYKRPIDDEFSIPDFLIDVLEHAAYYPRLLSFGGNTGTVNSFATVDFANLTGGAYNAAALLDPEKLGCFALQAAMAAGPDFLGSLYTDVNKAMTPLADKITQLLAGKACPVLQEYHSELFDDYPGYTQAYGSYAGFSEVATDPVGGTLEGVIGVIGGLLKGDNP